MTNVEPFINESISKNEITGQNKSINNLDNQYSLYDKDINDSVIHDQSNNNDNRYISISNDNSNIIINTPTKTEEALEIKFFKSPIKYCSNVFQAGSVKGSMFNLIVAVVGAGILAFPYAFRMSGLFLSLILLFIATIFSYLSLNLLVLSSNYLNKQYINNPCFRTLATQSSGPNLALFTQLCVMLSLFGSLISRIVGSGGIITILYFAFFNDDETKSKMYYKYSIIIFSCIIILPLSLLRNQNSLRFTSMLSVLCSFYLTIVLFIEYFRFCDDGQQGSNINTCFWKGKSFSDSIKMDNLFNIKLSGFLTTFPIFIFGYNCQPNVFPIYIELKDRSINKMFNVIFYALSISVSLYIIAGSFAYLLFLDDTCGNILTNKFNKSPEITIAALLFTASMLLASPVFANAIRKNINDIIFSKPQAPLKYHIIITVLIIVISSGISVLVSNIATVFGFIGCTTNPITGYILPAYFMWKLVPSNQYIKTRYSALFMAIIVTILSISSFIYKLYAIITKDNPTCDYAQKIS